MSHNATRHRCDLPLNNFNSLATYQQYYGRRNRTVVLVLSLDGHGSDMELMRVTCSAHPDTSTGVRAWSCMQTDASLSRSITFPFRIPGVTQGKPAMHCVVCHQLLKSTSAHR